MRLSAATASAPRAPAESPRACRLLPQVLAAGILFILLAKTPWAAVAGGTFPLYSKQVRAGEG